MAEQAARGVQFPLVDGRRSTTATGRATLAAAADRVDSRLARRIRGTAQWRKEYLTPARDLVAMTARSDEAALASACAGLDYLHDRFVFSTEGEDVGLRRAVDSATRHVFSTRSFAGSGTRQAQLEIPYRGDRLGGTRLRHQLRAWADAGVVMPSFAAGISTLMDHPEWLDLREHRFAVLGAGAELGPLRHLLEWGAQVWAVDLPRPDIWQRIISSAADTAGVLHVPVPARARVRHAASSSEVAKAAGVDLIGSAPDLAVWLAGIPGPFVLGNYGYADGALNVRLSMAADAVAVRLIRDRGDVGLAFLATPTDAFLVPMELVEDARKRWRHLWLARATRRPLRLAHLFQPNYARLAHSDSGEPAGVADCIVPQQGPNYLLAKRMQQWRASVARRDGVRVSLNVAPATRTRSVVKNKLLAAAYAGAGRFGIEVFEPDTCNALMAAALVRDLWDDSSPANPEVPLGHPWELFSDSAAHGGLWSTPYDPRSVLGVAAVLGMFEQAL